MDKKWTKWLIPAVLIVVLALVISGLVGAQSKATVGYIDMQRLQHELPQFQELQELLNSKNAEFNSFGNYLQTQQKNELAQLEKEKNAEIKGKSQEEIKVIEQKYQEKAMKAAEGYQKKLETENARLSGEVQSKHDGIFASIQKVLGEIAKKEGYSIILEKSVVYYGGEDLTDKVISAFKSNGK
jgi:outer membrane protein